MHKSATVYIIITILQHSYLMIWYKAPSAFIYFYLSVEFEKLEADVYVLQLQRFQVRRHVVVPGFSSETNVEVYSP